MSLESLINLFVVLFVVTDAMLPGVVAAVSSFVLLIGMWFIFPLHRRRRHGYGSTDKGA
jgi:hypothetical protein